MLGMDPLTLLDLLHQPEFVKGLLLGGLAAIAAVVSPRVGWLGAWTAAALCGLAWTGGFGWSPLVPWWGVPAVGIAAVFAAIGSDLLSRRHPGWLVPALYALSVLGVWGTVPDTERAAVLMGATAGALVAVAWPGRIRVGWPGALTAAGVLGYVALVDGAVRGGAIVGALGGLGLLIVAPATAAIVRFPPRFSPPFLLALQALFVIVSGRVAGAMQDPLAATGVIAASALVAGLGLTWVSLERTRQRPGRRGE